jgi:hypothetical protein
MSNLLAGTRRTLALITLPVLIAVVAATTTGVLERSEQNTAQQANRQDTTDLTKKGGAETSDANKGVSNWVLEFIPQNVSTGTSMDRCYAVMLNAGFALTTATCIETASLAGLRQARPDGSGPSYSVRAVVLPQRTPTSAEIGDLALIAFTKTNPGPYAEFSSPGDTSALVQVDQDGRQELIEARGYVTSSGEGTKRNAIATIPRAGDSQRCAPGRGWPLLTVTAAGSTRVIGFQTSQGLCNDGIVIWELIGTNWSWVQQAVECANQQLGVIPKDATPFPMAACRFVSITKN